MDLGIQIGLSVVLGVGLGYYAGRWLGHERVFLFLGLGLGIASAVRIMTHFIRRSMPGTDPGGPDKSKDEGRGSPGA
jgi:uncharacterized membrane protein HdeD (DUF308 family)